MAELGDRTSDITAHPARRAAGWLPVAAYVCAIYLTVPFVRPLTRWLRSYGLGWIFTGGIPALGVLTCALLLWRILSSNRPGRIRSVASLAAIAALYAFFMKTLATFPVERFHLIEYGLLGYMAGKRLSVPGRESSRGAWLAGAAVAAAAGFVDEVIQGFIPERYYDNRDVLVNMVSGVMGFWILRIVDPGRDREEARPSLSTVRLQPPVAAGAALAAVAVGMALVSRAPLDPSALAGAWDRVNEKGVCECYLFDGRGWMEWADGEGNRASGTYAVAGNRMDGPMLKLSIEQSCPPDGSGWQAGKEWNAYLRVSGHSWHFRRNVAVPFFKASPFQGVPRPRAGIRTVIEKEGQMVQNGFFVPGCCVGLFSMERQLRVDSRESRVESEKPVTLDSELLTVD